MSLIQAVKSDFDIDKEQDILLSCIVSDRFLKVTAPIYKPEFIQNELIRDIIDWCFNFYFRYRKAPFTEVEKYIDIRRSQRRLTLDQEELVKKVLLKINQQYEKQESFNVEFYLDRAREYFTKRDIELKISKTQLLLQKGKVDQARVTLESKTLVTTGLSHRAIRIGDPTIIEKTTNPELKQSILSLRGNFHKLLGPLRREWLCAVLAPPKTGKSTVLSNLALASVMNFQKTLIVNLEMDELSFVERLHRNITGSLPPNLDDEEYGVEVPVFDCYLNQTGTCELDHIKACGASLETCLQQNLEYTPCTVCFTQETPPSDDFILTTLKIPKKLPKLDEETYRMKVALASRHIDKYLRVVTFPSYSASVEDVKTELKLLEWEEGFVPSVIIIDYADIFYNPSGDRSGLDKIWKELKALAGEYKALVFSASQTNRRALAKILLGQEDVAEEFRKMAHVDLFIGLSQLDFERDARLVRWNVLVHRHRSFNPSRQLYVSTLPELNFAFLDSHFCNRKTLNRVRLKLKEMLALKSGVN